MLNDENDNEVCSSKVNRDSDFFRNFGLYLNEFMFLDCGNKGCSAGNYIQKCDCRAFYV